MIRSIVIGFAFLLFASGVRAEPNVPQIAESASAYRKVIDALSADANAAQLLGAIKQAQAAGKSAELIRLYEQFLALNKANYRAWLQLGLAWRAADATAEKGLGAAYNAYGTAPSEPNQVEALLLASSILRARLEQFRKDYQAARDDVEKATRLLAYLNDPTQNDDRVGNSGDPTGNVQVLTRARDQATRQAEDALQQIARVASELDEIYRDISVKVPGSDFDRMKDGDARSAIFAPVLVPASDQIRVDFRIVGSDIHVCIEFTQGLRANGLPYAGFVGVTTKDGDAVNGLGFDAKDRVLCVTGLKPGETYNVQIKQGLPSREGGKLADSASIRELKLPDLPKQVGFPGRQFILPTSGPGEVPLQVTNVDQFDLELFRITDRALYRHIALGHIGGELPRTEFNELRDHFAERLWSGSISVPESAAKKNERVQLSLRVRSILTQRREWLTRELNDNKGNQGAISSLDLPLSGVASDKVQVQGRFFAGSAQFEAAALNLVTPGVYALVTRAVREGATTDDDRSDDDSDKCKDKKKPGCGSFLIQWFLNTDIGLTFYEGDRDFTVVARSLSTGAAKQGVKIELVSASNRVLASGLTDANGVATFPVNLTRGLQSNAMVAILAQLTDDFGFLTFGPERLDLSRLNVDGRPIVHGFTAFLSTDRGIYQPGETVNLVALIRDSDGIAPDPAPKATVRLEARDRTLAQRRLDPKEWKLGGTMLPLSIPNTVRPGSARITIALGDSDNAPVIGETIVQVGPVRPDRARLTFLEPNKAWARRTAAGSVEVAGEVNAQYIFGAAGTSEGAIQDLKAEVIVKVAPADTPSPGCYAGFTFGRFDEAVSPSSLRLFKEYTDANGSLKLSLSGIPFPDATKPMAASVEVTLFDTAGPLASRSRTFPIVDNAGWIGISKIPRLRPGATAGTFDVGLDLISIRSDGQTSGRFEYRLERERDIYLWQRDNDTWQHVKSVRREAVSSGPIASGDLRPVPTGSQAADGTGCLFALHVEKLASGLDVGRYLLTITDTETGRLSSVRFLAGAAGTDADQLEPNIFILATDKQSYTPNEPIKITAEVPFNGEVLVALADGDVRQWASGQARNGIATITIPASPSWVGKGIYALATVFRSTTDGGSIAGPARAIGATHFEVKGQQAGYSALLRMVGSVGERLPMDGAYIAPNAALTFEACVAGPSGCSTNPPAEAYAIAFVVDEGLLSLTGHNEPPPDPARHFFGRTRFGLRVMDNYDRLLLKEGGDRPTRLALSNYTSAHIVAEARGPIKLENGKGVFSIPKVDLQNGTASIFVVIWSKDYTAATTARVGVRSNIVAELDVPGSLLAGDRAIMPLRLANIDYRFEGDFAVHVTSSGPVTGLALFNRGETPPAPAPQIDATMRLRQSDPRTLYVAVNTAPEAQGKAKLFVTIDPIGATDPLRGNKWDWSFDLRPAALSSTDTIGFPLGRQPTDLGRLVEGMIADGYNPETVTVVARLSDGPQGLLAAAATVKDEATLPILDHLVWRGMLLLNAQDRNKSTERNPEVVRILGDLLSLQLPNGSFVPYRTQGEFTAKEITLVNARSEDGPEPPDGLLRAATALDFVELASAMGYDVPDRALRSAGKFVNTEIAARNRTSECSFDVVYALLVLVSHESVAVDRTMLDALLKCPQDDIAVRAAAAAASTKYGLSDQAKTLLQPIEEGNDPAKFANLSDYRLAMVLSFLGDAGASPKLMDSVANILLPANRTRAALSKAALAWVVRQTPPAKALSAPALTLADLVIQGAPGGLFRRAAEGVWETDSIPYSRLRAAPISIGTRRDAQVRGSITIEGLLRKPGEASRFPAGALKRRFFDADGLERDLTKNPPKLGERLVVVLEGGRKALPTLTGTNGQELVDRSGPLLVADFLPSAFQIVSSTVFDNPTVTLRGALAQLKSRGDLRSVTAGTDRWIALIVPESWRNVQETEPDQDGGGDAATPKKAPPARGDEVEFRQAYLVRVAMAGHFTFPGISIEPTLPPIKTMRAEQTVLDVKPTDATDR